MPSEWSNVVVGTIVLASIYGTVAAGFVVLFRATKVLSFAQGGFMLIGALFFYTLTNNEGWSIYPSMVVAIVGSLVLGWLTYRLLFARLVGSEPFVMAIATLGVATVFQMVAYMIWGTNILYLPSLTSFTPKLLFGTFSYNQTDVITVAMAIVLGVGVALIIRFTRVGIQMRATADQQELAAYSGIHVTRVCGLAWGIGAALACAGGIAYALSNNVDPSSIPSIGLDVFPAIILGGLDSYLGAYVGAILVGFLNTEIGITIGGQWQDAVAYLVLLAVLLIRPRGLFGSHDILRI
jgi:branched-chain amino acid transport system permease protein